MQILINKVLSPFQKLTRNNYRGCRPVANFIILGFGNFDHHLSGRVLNFHFVKDGRPVIGDSNIAEPVDKHLVHAFWSERRLH